MFNQINQIMSQTWFAHVGLIPHPPDSSVQRSFGVFPLQRFLAVVCSHPNDQEEASAH